MPHDLDFDCELSVVMPCLNEASTLYSCIRSARDTMREAGIRGEVIVADNGSTDDSLEIARSLGARVVQERRRGYGSALRAGCEAARGKFILMADADESYDFGELGSFLRELRGGSELVMGTRLKGKIDQGAMPWKNRYLGNPVLTRFLNRLYGTHVSDAHCGMRAFTKEAYRRMNLRSSGMEFASEMVIGASRSGLRVSEVPIAFHRDGRDRPPHLRPWRDGWRHLKLILVFSPTALFLVPGMAFFLLGLALMVGQLFAPLDRPLEFLGVRMDFHWAILGSLLALVGYQILTTYFLVRIYSVVHLFRRKDRVLQVGFRLITLDRALVVGLVMLLAGLVLDGVVVLRWLSSDFGALVGVYTRLFILGSTLICLAIQTIFNAFFLSILGDAYKKDISTEESAAGEEAVWRAEPRAN